METRMSNRDLPMIERKQCGAVTYIDREGMSDLECQEEPGHWGFHRFQDDAMTVLWDYSDKGHLAGQSSHRMRQELLRQKADKK